MKLVKSNQINGIILLILGSWGYYLVSDLMLLILPIGGVVLLFLSLFLNRKNKVVLYGIGVITVSLILFLSYYLVFRLSSSDFTFILRMLTMLFSCVVSIVIFVKCIRKNTKNNITLGSKKRSSNLIG